jgi:hypothetical protein
MHCRGQREQKRIYVVFKMMGHRSNLQKFGSSLREKDLIEFVPKSLFKVGVCQTQPIGRLQDKMTTTTQSLSI